ncbi:hypothetical protein PMAYCL1PPCAC_02645, partial [Pristionchus mayeri]
QYCYCSILALMAHLGFSLDCYDFASKFPIPCEELVWFEECFALYNKSEDGKWKMEDAGCSGTKMKSHLNKIMKEEGMRVKLSPDRKAIFQFIPEGSTFINCLDPFCNLPDRIINRLEKELNEEEETTTEKVTTTTEVPSKTKEDEIERILSGRGRKAFEVNNELGVRKHRETKRLIFAAPDRSRRRL